MSKICAFPDCGTGSSGTEIPGKAIEGSEYCDYHHGQYSKKSSNKDELDLTRAFSLKLEIVVIPTAEQSLTVEQIVNAMQSNGFEVRPMNLNFYNKDGITKLLITPKESK